jgi:hypothetical protein
MVDTDPGKKPLPTNIPSTKIQIRRKKENILQRSAEMGVSSI